MDPKESGKRSKNIDWSTNTFDIHSHSSAADLGFSLISPAALRQLEQKKHAMGSGTPQNITCTTPPTDCQRLSEGLIEVPIPLNQINEKHR